MGNANALIQSDDWAALITDAKSRNCYMDMESLPKDFLGQKGSTQSTLPGKNSSNIRGLRSGLPRHRTLDIHVESRSGTPSEDDEKSNSAVITRNGNYRPSKAAVENSPEDFDQSGEKLRDTWQYGMQKRQSSAGTVGKRDI